VLIAQVGVAFAAPAFQEGFITGTVTALACETDPTTGATTILVTVQDSEGALQTFRIDQAAAEEAGLVTIVDGIPDCSEEALAASLGTEVSIDPATIIPEEETPQHPVGLVLSIFFSDIIDYETIMAVHDDGTGFGVLAQALWLTLKLEGDSDAFLAVINAKKTKDFSAFVLEDGTTPQNWGQFKKAVLNGDKKANLGVIMSNKDKNKTNNESAQEKDKTNNGKGKNKNK
jgi:hypothetical protein